MNGLMQVLVVAVLVLETLAIGQGADLARVLAGVREALGGDAAISAVKTVMVEGTRARIAPDGQSRPSRFEMAIELPGRFARKEAMGNFNGVDLMRTTGFNGSDLIDRADAPPQSGGGRMIVQMRPSDMVRGGTTPDQMAAERENRLSAARKDFARLAIGMFGAGPEVFPVEFGYGGTAESPDATAHVLTVTGADGFDAKLYVDTVSHLPLMLTWMDKEPLMVTAGGPGGGVQIVQRGGGGAVSEQDITRMRQEMEQRMREAEANRRVVEYRLFYADYKSFGSVKLPTRLERMIDGTPVEEWKFETVVVNGPIDPAFFAGSGR
jgi:hypothetical protein